MRAEKNEDNNAITILYTQLEKVEKLIKKKPTEKGEVLRNSILKKLEILEKKKESLTNPVKRPNSNESNTDDKRNPNDIESGNQSKSLPVAEVSNEDNDDCTTTENTEKNIISDKPLNPSKKTIREIHAKLSAVDPLASKNLSSAKFTTAKTTTTIKSTSSSYIAPIPTAIKKTVTSISLNDLKTTTNSSADCYITPAGFSIPSALKILETDTETEIATKRKKIQKLKQQQRQEKLTEAAQASANEWQKFKQPFINPILFDTEREWAEILYNNQDPDLVKNTSSSTFLSSDIARFTPTKIREYTEKRTEFLCLSEFAKFTDYTKWLNNYGWDDIVTTVLENFKNQNRTSIICSAYGLQCNSSGEVISIYLPFNNLKGELPNCFGAFSKLISINLASSRLALDIKELGSILPGLPNLAKNYLSGRLPDSLWSHPSLMSINLSHNNFTTPLSEIGISLREVDLSNNIMKSFPSIKIGYNLKFLNLSFNYITLIPETQLLALPELTKLLEFDVSHNSIEGNVIPPKVENLKIFYIGYNEKAIGEINEYTEISPNLEKISVIYTQLTGELTKFCYVTPICDHNQFNVHKLMSRNIPLLEEIKESVKLVSETTKTTFDIDTFSDKIKTIMEKSTDINWNFES